MIPCMGGNPLINNSNAAIFVHFHFFLATWEAIDFGFEVRLQLFHFCREKGIGKSYRVRIISQ